MDISGKVMTVKGVIDPSDLKKTITHEHFFIDLSKSHFPHQPLFIINLGIKLLEIHRRHLRRPELLIILQDLLN